MSLKANPERLQNPEHLQPSNKDSSPEPPGNLTGKMMKKSQGWKARGQIGSQVWSFRSEQADVAVVSTGVVGPAPRPRRIQIMGG